MNASKPRLPHFSFFEALASAPDEASVQWRTAKAGLVTLRMLDNWAEQGAEVITSNTWGVHAVRRTIMQIDKGDPLRALILNVLEAMRSAPEAMAVDATPQLFAYARGLEFDAQWALAADVYWTIIKHAMGDVPVMVSAYMYLGASERMLAKWKEATTAYKAAGTLAKLSGDTESVIRVQIAMGKLSIDRGNLPRAEQILDKAIAQAEKAGLEDIRAVALHDRADVAHHRGQFELAIDLAYKALNGTTEQAERDRVLSDMAASFFELGLKDAARDAHMILAATAQQQYGRWVATVNLLEIAATDGNEAIFEQYRRELAKASLPASLAVHYHFYTGQGYRSFGHRDMAIQALEKAVALAAEHGLNEILIKAEQSLDETRKGDATPMVTVSEGSTVDNYSPVIADVASAIHEMRALVSATA